MSKHGSKSRASDPESSHEAADLKRGFPWKLLLAGCQWGEFTDDLLVEKVGGQRNVVARRRLDLEREKIFERITDAKGTPVYAIGPSNTKTLTFRVTAKGREMMSNKLTEKGLTQ